MLVATNSLQSHLIESLILVLIDKHLYKCIALLEKRPTHSYSGGPVIRVQLRRTFNRYVGTRPGAGLRLK